MMTKLLRLLRNVPVLLSLATSALLALAVPVFAADAPALPPGVSLPPGAQKLLESRLLP
jgi:hypothetical protein